MNTGADPDKPQQDSAAADQEAGFIRGLVERGEAVRVAPGETLPPGATHEIVGERPDGLPIVRRRRFSAA